jgi:hypothetical protein
MPGGMDNINVPDIFKRTLENHELFQNFTNQ